MFSPSSIDIIIDDFVNAIHFADEHAIPMKRIRASSFPLPRDIRVLIVIRGAKIRLYRRTRIFLIKCEIDLLSRRIEFLIKKHVNLRFKQSLVKINQDSGDYHRKLWKISKFFKNRPQMIPPLSLNQRLLVTDEEKCEAFADRFRDVHDETNIALGSDVVSKRVKDSLLKIDSTRVDPDSIEFVSDAEVLSIISSLKNDKAPDLDRVGNRHLKNLPILALTILTCIFNACLIHNYFPKVWRQSKVRSICKPNKDPACVGSYRLISLLSALSKIFERILLSRMNIVLEDNSIIPEHQFGFRHGRSCALQLLRLTNFIKSNLRSKKSVGMLSVDLKSAFDCMASRSLTQVV